MKAFTKLIPAQKPDKPQKPRPYWHVDAKWLFGLVLCVVLGFWLLLVAAHRVTSRDIGIDLMTNMVTMGIAKNGAVDQAGLDELKRKISESPTKSIQPIPGFPATITEQDLALPPEQVIDRVFRQITEPLYDKGARKFAQEQTSDKTQQDKFVNDASLIGLISKEGHDKIGGWVLAGFLVVCIIAAGAIWFSAGFGRLVTPGLVLLLVSFPGLILFSGLRAWVSQPAERTVEAQDISQAFMAARGSFLPVAEAGQQTYKLAVLLGIGLLVAALLGKIIVHAVRRARQPADKPAKDDKL